MKERVRLLKSKPFFLIPRRLCHCADELLNAENDAFDQLLHIDVDSLETESNDETVVAFDHFGMLVQYLKAHAAETLGNPKILLHIGEGLFYLSQQSKPEYALSKLDGICEKALNIARATPDISGGESGELELAGKVLPITKLGDPNWIIAALADLKMDLPAPMHDAGDAPSPM